jgi:fumarate reductase subunit C
MTPNPLIMKTVEQLNYRVTVGDIAASAGLEINQAQQGLLALASEASGHLQVAESGEIVYLFPKNFRSILQNKYLKLRLQQWWQKIWKILFYIIRISFGIVLIASIVLLMVAIVVVLVALNSSRDGDNDSDSGGGMVFMPGYWFSPDFFWIFDPGYDDRRQDRDASEKKMNFLEAVFSYLFGDGNPNYNLEERRWQTIGSVIRNNQGAVIAQQIAPYLDEIDRTSNEDEDYILPVLARFNGYPEVSPQGEIIYYFPDLQVTATQSQKKPILSYLKEHLWRFSQADSSQIMLSIGLGVFEVILALVLGSLLKGIAASAGFIGFVASIYWFLLGYGIAFLGVPLIRYFWIQWRNEKIASRNQQREQRAKLLNQADANLREKMVYAKQFAAQKFIGDKDLAYTTESDSIDQEIADRDKLDAEWQKRLESNS